MDQLNFDMKCRILQHLYAHLDGNPTWSEFIDNNYFALGVADMLVGGDVRELANEGAVMLENTFDDLVAFIEQSPDADIKDIIRALI